MNVVYAKESRFVPNPDGGGRMVHGGQHWPADDPIVAAHPDLFSTDPRYGLAFSVDPAGWDDPPVERVTAGPGEKRTGVRRG